MVRILPAFFLVAGVAGCHADPSDTEGNGPVGTDDSTSPSTTETASVIGPPVFFTEADGTVLEESCSTNLKDFHDEHGPAYSVGTNEEKSVEPGDYTISYGDMSLASDASSGLPLHTLSNGWLAIGPTTEAFPVNDGEEVELEAPYVNMYAGETWTCAFDNGFEPEQGTAKYEEDGVMLSLPGLGYVEVSGMRLSADADGILKEGDFISDIYLEISSEGGMAGNYNAACWAGNAGADPR
jgi:hypothetical protein